MRRRIPELACDPLRVAPAIVRGREAAQGWRSVGIVVGDPWGMKGEDGSR